MKVRLLFFCLFVVTVSLCLEFFSRPQKTSPSPPATKSGATPPVLEDLAGPIENPRLSEIEQTSASTAYLDDLKEALKSRNPEEVVSSFLQLGSHFERNPEALNEIASVLKSDAELYKGLLLLAQINLDNPTIGGDQLLRAVAFELAQSESNEYQNLSLGLLSKTPSPTSDLVQIVSQLALQTGDNQVRISALSTLESWAGKDPNLKPAIGDALLDIANASTDNEARMRSLAAIANLGLPDDILSEATELLWKEGSEANRSLLAAAYEKGGDALIASTLARLEQACTRASPSTQKIILAQIARVGKMKAIDILQRLPANLPGLRADADNYIKILQDGAMTIAEIDRRKLETEVHPTNP